jgi:hypothetical protein
MWFSNNSVPQVNKHLRLQGSSEEAVLLLDNAPVHPSENTLTTDSDKFYLMYLPLNVTAVIHPRIEGVIVALKRH